MSQLQRKIVWAEGLFLGQQHFQQWDQGFRKDLRQRTRLLNPHCWGIIDIAITDEALEMGQCRVEAVSAVFSNGQWVHFDSQSEGGPLICDLNAGGDRVDVWLTQPDNDRVGGINGYQEQGRLCAWRADYQTVPDENDPARTREVIVGTPNLALLRGDESREHYAAIKIAVFEQQGDGRYALVENYIPPVINVKSSETLMTWMWRVRDFLAARVRQLSQQRNSYGDLADMGSREIGQFLRLLQLRPALAMIDHLIQQEDGNPETLFLEMVRLVTGLRDFQPDMPELELPVYQHAELGSVFASLERLLRESLAQSAKTASTALSLKQESQALLVAEGIPWSGMGKQHLYLGVYHETEDPGWVTDFGKQVKSGSREDLELILASALPGVRLSHTQRPPNKLPVKSGFEYFRFEPTGEFWPRALEAESLAVFLPVQFQPARFELLCVEE